MDISASYRGSNVAPVYPSLSLKNREQGTVVLRVLVKSDGTAGNVEIKSSSDYPRLDQSAIQAVKAWRFNPATVDGKSIDEWYEVPIIFKSPKGEKSIPPLAYDIECSSDVTSWRALDHPGPRGRRQRGSYGSRRCLAVALLPGMVGRWPVAGAVGQSRASPRRGLGPRHHARRRLASGRAPDDGCGQRPRARLEAINRGTVPSRKVVK